MYSTYGVAENLQQRADRWSARNKPHTRFLIRISKKTRKIIKDK